MLTRSCARCGNLFRGDGWYCPAHKRANRQRNNRPVNPQYHDRVYVRNRKLMADMWWRNGWPCWLCGKPFASKSMISADHVVPLDEWTSTSSPHDISNLRGSHLGCNAARSNRRRAAKRRSQNVAR